MALALLCLSLLASNLASAQTDCAITESFDSGFDENWEVSDPARVQSIDGVLRVQFQSATDRDVAWATSKDCIYQDFTLEAKVRDRDFAGSVNLSFRNHGVQRLGYSLNLRSSFQDLVLAKGAFGMRFQRLAEVPVVHSTDEWRTLKVVATGPRIQGYLDGVLLIDVIDPDPYLEGWVDLGLNAGGNLTAFAEYDDVRIEDVRAVALENPSWGAVKSRF